MEDRELIELAAKAAGVCLHPEDKLVRSYGNWGCDTTCKSCKKNPSDAAWDPLGNDGDALRLAVKLGMSLRLAQFEEWTQVYVDDLYSRAAKPVTEHAGRTQNGQTIEQATRRAIVRAAAEIGKAMQEKH